MTPEQAAAYVNAQVAMFYGELELLKAQGTFISVQMSKVNDPGELTGDGGRVWLLDHKEDVAVHVVVDPVKLKELLSRYDTVLSHNGVLTTFGHANEPGFWSGPR